jgi:hypothetical protein
MHSFLLQDRLTISGTNNPSTIIQTEPGWLDLSPYQDIIASVEVYQDLGAPTLYFETAPLKEERLFAAMNPNGLVMNPPSPLPQIVTMTMGAAAVPLATFLRWRVVGTVAGWNVTFRILIAANSPGAFQPPPSPFDGTRLISSSFMGS